METLMYATLIISVFAAVMSCYYAFQSMKECEKNIFFTPEAIEESRKYEPRKVIHDWGLNFNLGSALKHIEKASNCEDGLDDLLKARQFIEFEIEEMKLSDIEMNYISNDILTVKEINE